jgi:hypothetical protein
MMYLRDKKKKCPDATFDVLPIVTMKNTVFWDVMLCSLVDGFGGTYSLHLQRSACCLLARLTVAL